MKYSKKYQLILTFILFAITLFIFTGCTKQSEESPEVKVALNTPMTGAFGLYGQCIRDGALFALEDLKKEGSNVELKFDLQDNEGKPSKTVSVMQKQFLKSPDIYVSGVKPQTMAIFDEVTKKGIPHFVWIFDAFICAQNPNTFRTWVSFKYEPEKYIQYIKCKKPKKIAIAYVNVPHVKEEMDNILVPKLKEMGYTDADILIEIFDWTQRDFKNIVAKIKSFAPDLAILSGFQANIVALVKLLRSYGMIHDGNVIGTYDMIDAGAVLSAAQLEGVRLITPLFNVSTGSAESKKWKEKFREKYGREPLYTDAYSYDMIRIIADAAKRVKPPATSEEWIKALKETDMEGVTGRLLFDKDGDLEVALRIGVYRNGEIVIDNCDKQ